MITRRQFVATSPWLVISPPALLGCSPVPAADSYAAVCADTWRLGARSGLDGAALGQELVRCATLAPSWVYANTRSLFLAVLMHASYTGWLLVLYPATSFEQGLVWQSAFAVALWLVVAVVMLEFVRREPRTAPLE